MLDAGPTHTIARAIVSRVRRDCSRFRNPDAARFTLDELFRGRLRPSRSSRKILEMSDRANELLNEIQVGTQRSVDEAEERKQQRDDKNDFQEVAG